jgi:tetratricopeptide (TPR) repeat protein
MTPRAQRIDELTRTGMSFHQQGRLAQAERCFDELLRLDARNFLAAYLLGLISAQTGRPERAVELIRRATAIDPRVPEAHYNLGNLLLALERSAEAVTSFDRAVALKPDHAGAHANRGTALLALTRPGDALASFDRVLALTPNEPAAHYNRGVALEALERFADALASYDRAIALRRDYGEAHGNRGVVLNALGRFDEALASFDASIALRPDHAESWSNRGNPLLAVGRLDDALVSYERAIALSPDYADAVHNRAIHRLLTGDFARGLADFEARKRKRQPIANLSFPQPLWLGESSLEGRTILVHDEQGLGDTIQFCRYLPLLEAMGARVLFAPDEPLCALLRSMPGDCAIVDIDDPSLSFDVHCPLMSLPLAFATRLDTIPARVPYMRAEPARVERWAERIGREGFTIGVCWQGRIRTIRDDRAFPLAALAGIARLPGVRLISLHKGAGEAELAGLRDGMAVEVLGAEFDPGLDAFLDTAAVMMSCDLIITSDTAVAHLAGALARPVWVALKNVPDWRWQLERSDTPWYPTMRLFRQTKRDDWREVFAAMEMAIRPLLEAQVS